MKFTNLKRKQHKETPPIGTFDYDPYSSYDEYQQRKRAKIFFEEFFVVLGFALLYAGICTVFNDVHNIILAILIMLLLPSFYGIPKMIWQDAFYKKHSSLIPNIIVSFLASGAWGFNLWVRLISDSTNEFEDRAFILVSFSTLVLFLLEGLLSLARYIKHKHDSGNNEASDMLISEARLSESEKIPEGFDEYTILMLHKTGMHAYFFYFGWFLLWGWFINGFYSLQTTALLYSFVSMIFPLAFFFSRLDFLQVLPEKLDRLLHRFVLLIFLVAMAAWYLEQSILNTAFIKNGTMQSALILPILTITTGSMIVIHFATGKHRGE